MNYLSIFLLVTTVLVIHPMEEEEVRHAHNTYEGREITPESLLTMNPKMTSALEEQTDQWMEQYQGFVSDLVTTPHPLDHAACGQKTKDNFARIAELKERGEVENLSEFNYVLRFHKHPNFTVPINRWGSRVAYWAYASGQGSVLDPEFKARWDRGEIDCSQFAHMPSYQHCSRVAHYLRLKEIMERKGFQYLRTTPTHLQHIPGKPESLSDENYVVVQEWAENLKELKQLEEREQLSIRKNIPPDALQEMHNAIVYAAIWDMRGNLSVTGNESKYYMVDLEEPFNHKPQFFFFQREEGKRKYVEDVIAGLERMAQKFHEEPEQFERWKRCTENDLEFKRLCDQYGIYPNYDPEHLKARD